MSKKNKKPQKTAGKKEKSQVKKDAKSALKTPKNTQKTRKKTPRSKSTAKKTPINSISETVKAGQGAFLTIEPPENIKLSVYEERFFENIIDEFATSEWTQHTIEMAAILARCMYKLDYETKKMKREGSVLTRKKIIPPVICKKTGNTLREAEEFITSHYANPRKTFIDSYTNQIIALRRSLSLHARATDGDTRDIKNRRAAAKKIEDGIRNADDPMSLINFPTQH